MRFKWNIDFIKKSKYFYTFSIVVTLIGIISLIVFQLNYGVDFRSGSNVDIAVSKQVTKEDMQNILTEANLNNENAVITPGSGRVSVRFPNVLSEDDQTKLTSVVESKIGKDASIEINTVDTEIAKELERNALIAVLVASLGIIIYVTIRFEWRFAVSAIVALLHDAFMVISVFSIFQLEVNLTFIIALLTIVGYSINDTVVIFDRIRENMRFAKIKSHQDLHDVVNKSISQTMTRSLNTVFTVFIASVALLIFGSESIRMFSLAMVIGLLFGAYSSIFIASPLWYALRGIGQDKGKKKPAKATT
ncbi:protein translocase subunit SecF [Paenibacillus caui]|uniref:protein translocase subunit SecF n=1 Tax=Paenibacillus caui TaxID=2873927 RepID=UPI001CA8E4C1